MRKNGSFFRQYFFLDDLSSDAKLVNMICSIAVAGVFIAMMVRIAMGAFSGLIIVLALLQALILLIMYAASRFRTLAFSKNIIIVLVCFVLMPLAFFFFGGTNSSIDCYFVLSLVIILLLIRGWLCTVFVVIQIAIAIVCHYIHFLFPHLVIQLSGGAEHLRRIHFFDQIQGYVIAGLAIGSIVTLQSRLTRSEKSKGEVASRNLEMAQRTTKAMFDCNPHINILFDSDFKVIDCNPMALDYLGFSTKEELLANFVDRIVKAIPEFQSDGRPSASLMDRLKAATEEGAVHFETELHLPDGKKIVSVELKHIPYGGSFATVGYLVDITSVRDAEDELVRRGRLLTAVNRAATVLSSDMVFDDALYESMSILANGAGLDRIYVWSYAQIDGKNVYLQLFEWLNDVGRSRETVKSRTSLPYIYPIPEWEEKFPRGECINGPLRTLSQNERAVVGPYGVVSILLIPVFFQNRFWGFLSFDDCHSERTFSENEVSILQSGSLLIASTMIRNEMTRKISDTAARLNTVIGKYNGIIWSVDKTGIITTFNGRYLSEIGITPDYFEGKNLDQARVKNRFLDIIQNVTETLADGQERDWISDLEEGVFHSQLTPLYDVNGSIAGVMGSTDDITETIRLQRELETAMEDAHAASRAKSEFLSNMSHEIRTPMNAIIGMTSIGKSSKDMERKDYAFGKIEDASTHLLGIINDILDMSKIEAGKFELSYEEFNLEKLLWKVSDVMAFRMDEKRQKFMVRIDRNIPSMIIGDDQRLTQVITNLLSNAVKFTPESGSIFLNAICEKEEKGIITFRFEVRDTGIGISLEQQSRLFKSFQQAESGTSRKFGGTGLGLAISKSIVEMMGGNIWVNSEEGKGATFAFTAKMERGKGEAPRMVTPGANMGNIRVLLVDDAAEVRDYFIDIAQRVGFHTDVAESAEAALDLINRNGNYNIYFIDWKMPGMDGLELSRRIKQLDDGNSVITIITSADWSSVETEAKAIGIDSILSKPLFPSAIANCINEYLGLESIRKEESAAIITENDRYENSHILLAEDIEINREIVFALLEPTQVNITSAENGKIAAETYCQTPDAFDMIFMDLQMPVMDGFEATQRIREFEQEQEKTTGKARRIPIIAMTANVFREDIEKCLAFGMDDHIGKPLALAAVIEKIRKYLAKAP